VFQSKSLRVPWLSLAKSFPLYAAVIGNVTHDWGFIMMQICLPQYFRDVLHVKIQDVRCCYF